MDASRGFLGFLGIWVTDFSLSRGIYRTRSVTYRFRAILSVCRGCAQVWRKPPDACRVPAGWITVVTWRWRASWNCSFQFFLVFYYFPLLFSGFIRYTSFWWLRLQFIRELYRRLVTNCEIAFDPVCLGFYYLDLLGVCGCSCRWWAVLAFVMCRINLGIGGLLLITAGWRGIWSGEECLNSFLEYCGIIRYRVFGINEITR